LEASNKAFNVALLELRHLELVVKLLAIRMERVALPDLYPLEHLWGANTDPEGLALTSRR